MNLRGFTFSRFFIRFIAALVMVLLSYNPAGYSYFHLVLNPGTISLPVVILLGVLLAIVWVIFIRATLRSLGPIGIGLAVALFGCLLWIAVDQQWVTVASQLFIYLLLIVLAAVLGIGMSWSHVRRRLSGQTDVDDVESP